MTFDFRLDNLDTETYEMLVATYWNDTAIKIIFKWLQNQHHEMMKAVTELAW